MEIAKYQGSGNDFILIDNRDGKVYTLLDKLGITIKDFVVKVCTFHTGVGADGLILIEEPKDRENDFSWQFFNSDGSVAEMCGNGSRCAVRFAYEKGICKEEVKFETLAGIIKAYVKEGGKVVKVKLTKPKDYRKVSLEVDGLKLDGSFINTGVPHFVAKVDNLENFPVVKYGRLIRFHKEFEPKGTNVNFIEPLDDQTIRIRTYERGVESETLACGTGATASALISYMEGYVNKRPVKVITKGGEVLLVDFDDKMEEVYLEGRVVKVFEGVLSYEILDV
ncbi:diaminopimelate epimerase [Thermocrinis minervae]|uniref:Diaminopimelate epimerase n=1 Tax=Thermocrinis minervae TaxID=381751 RepID=A0A1M6T113_9AQUI|nr:diaminopimelate epimerase [Thermocrinis minervae]SHK50641.1 diaminopimelate epimerase [Thermocrinis minervae]